MIPMDANNHCPSFTTAIVCCVQVHNAIILLRLTNKTNNKPTAVNQHLEQPKATILTVIRRYWKHYSHFMFWAWFFNYKKGPCFLWFKELAEEKKQNAYILKCLNGHREPELNALAELTCLMWWLILEVEQENDEPPVEVYESHGQIDVRGNWGWTRLATILSLCATKPSNSLCPRAKKKWPNTLVVKDSARPHSHEIQRSLHLISEIWKVLWHGNSPSLNKVELLLPILKGETTKDWPPSSKEKAAERWQKAWADIQQKIICCRIQHIWRHLIEIICHEGGNKCL